MNNILIIKDLHKKYHTKNGELVAIDNINLEIKEGEYISIVGPSGCGKSTLLSILANIDTKTDGEIISKEKNKIGYMLQEDCLFPWLTILDNCLLGLKINKTLTKENIKYVENLLNTYGLSNFKDSYPNNLSGGMRQRVVRLQYTHK